MSFWLLPVTRSEQIKAVIFILSCQFAYFINILSSEVKYYILFRNVLSGLISSSEIKSRSLLSHLEGFRTKPIFFVPQNYSRRTGAQLG